MSLLLAGFVLLAIWHSCSSASKSNGTSVTSDAKPLPKKRTQPQTSVLADANPGSILDRLKAAREQGGDTEVHALLETLGTDLEENFDDLTAILTAIKTENDSDLITLLARLVAEHGGNNGRKLLKETVLSVAQTDRSPARRSALLAILPEISEMDSTLMPVVSSVARSDADADVRRIAIHSLDRWRQQQPASSEAITRELASIMKSCSDPKMRADLQEMLQSPDEATSNNTSARPASDRVN